MPHSGCSVLAWSESQFFLKKSRIIVTSNYFEKFLVFASAVSGCDSIPIFPSLVHVPVGITRSAVGIKTCAITARVKKYKSIVNKKKGKNIII